MNRKLAALIFLAALPLVSIAEDRAPSKPGVAVMGRVIIKATVEDIDYKTRHVTLAKDDGTTETLKVGPAAHNFDKVKKGDMVTFDYVEALALDIKEAKPGESLGTESATVVERAPKGGQPGATVTEHLTIKALVDDINYDTRRVTLKGEDGKSVTMKVGEHAKRFKEVKKGDHVVVQYTEALAIAVKSANS